MALGALLFALQALAPGTSFGQVQERSGDAKGAVNVVVRMTADQRKVLATSEYGATMLRLSNEYDRPILVTLSTADPTPGGIGDSLRPKGKSDDVVIKPGETVVLGGLLGGESVAVKTGPPILNKLPILGSLFRNRGYQDNQHDIIVMITPRTQ